ncbi:TauD/TfdA family dioxygenase [Actinomadura sp. DC4]|uniref:TauD/TfdA family dioxygenase n=1 Tax=Actinomadura sp. DC4 TaxID=3055069 RepID=UPI0025AF513E|nr:TauD/TfdA family dioxygenase [Actinomadura sp. DC4]MDN3353871.1 TauD/TfdA family dioxygenase [Actinomadura sp. DC4]
MKASIDDFQAAKETLAHRGWAVLRGLPFVHDGEPDISSILRTAACFGRPSDREGGTPAWAVRPASDDARQTFSRRTGGATLHTDAQYRRVPEHLVCLFAVRPADDGGTTRILSASDARTALRGHEREHRLLERLARPDWAWRVPAPFDGEPPFRAAVLPGDGTIRWRVDNLAAGADRETAREFAQRLETAPQVIELRLGVGDAVVLDNRRVLHGRTFFADRRRFMVRVRLWDRP